jgi:hypothetical protein
MYKFSYQHTKFTFTTVAVAGFVVGIVADIEEIVVGLELHNFDSLEPNTLL